MYLILNMLTKIIYAIMLVFNNQDLTIIGKETGDFLVLVKCHISINSYSRQITVCGNTAQPSDLFFEIFHKRKKV